MQTWINYHHLYYFMVIAESGSVSAAAEKLRLGQPTLSSQLKQFEETLGVRLFERRHKKLFLSEQGKIALDYARVIFRTGNEMFEALHDRLKPTRIDLRLGALDSIPKQIMLQMSRSAYKISPCTLTLVEGKFQELMREVLSHRIDLVVSNFLPKGEEMQGLHHRLVAKNPVAIYGPTKFRELRKGFPGSLRGKPMILPTHDSQMRYALEHWMRLEEIEVDVIAETQDTSLSKMMSASGLALMAAPLHAVTRQVLAGELCEIGRLKMVTEDLYIICAKRKLENPVASELMKTFEI